MISTSTSSLSSSRRSPLKLTSMLLVTFSVFALFSSSGTLFGSSSTNGVMLATASPVAHPAPVVVDQALQLHARNAPKAPIQGGNAANRNQAPRQGGVNPDNAKNRNQGAAKGNAKNARTGGIVDKARKLVGGRKQQDGNNRNDNRRSNNNNTLGNGNAARLIRIEQKIDNLTRLVQVQLGNGGRRNQNNGNRNGGRQLRGQRGNDNGRNNNAGRRQHSQTVTRQATAIQTATPTSTQALVQAPTQVA
ncbi:hypothetical protein BCR44DRAFT_409910 [Catenaria anguillulae PL171]|uniref:Uncharacterized protein n=1 Tax=Catenaria anguillulae PL171 TaxID=765915 RepID=A0A1Y2HDJ8_9FUNG|nr:hypothetical protein BCR44DRAFT_409910 [Catenaria anguillulae PL171]